MFSCALLCYVMWNKQWGWDPSCCSGWCCFFQPSACLHCPCFVCWTLSQCSGRAGTCRANYRLGEGNTSSHVRVLKFCQAVQLKLGMAGHFWQKFFAIWADRVCVTSCFFACSVKICLQLGTDDICGVQMGCSERPSFAAWCIDLKNKEHWKFCIFWVVIVGH